MDELSENTGINTGRRGFLQTAALAGAAFAAGGFASANTGSGGGDTIVPERNWNVRRFGATGDGQTDDTAACQAAIDVCLEAGGGCVYFPAGSYRITKSLVFKTTHRMDIVGDGTSTTLLHVNDEPLLLWPEDAVCAETSIRHFSFTSVENDKSRETAVIHCKNGIERCFFSHLFFSTSGAKMGSGIVSERVMDTTTIDHCLMWGPVTGTGIKIARGSEVRIFGARIIGGHRIYDEVDDQSIGIHLTGDNGGVHVVTTDIIALHTGMLIGQEGNTSNREIFITHATFDSCVHGLVQIDNAYTSIAGCWAASSDEDQILLAETAPYAIMVISGGTIFNGGAYGRPGGHNGFVAKAGSFCMNGVTVRHNKGTGILLEGDSVRDYTITGCRIVNNGTGAVLSGNGYVFSNNVLARNDTELIDNGGPEKNVDGNVIRQ